MHGDAMAAPARNETAIEWSGSISATEKQKTANATRPVAKPRSSCAAAAGPSCTWVNAASTVASTGNEASRPLRCGPSEPARPVSRSTSAAVAAARRSRSKRGGGRASLGGRAREEQRRGRERRADEHERQPVRRVHLVEQEGRAQERRPSDRRRRQPAHHRARTSRRRG